MLIKLDTFITKIKSSSTDEPNLDDLDTAILNTKLNSLGIMNFKKGSNWLCKILEKASQDLNVDSPDKQLATHVAANLRKLPEDLSSSNLGTNLSTLSGYKDENVTTFPAALKPKTQYWLLFLNSILNRIFGRTNPPA